MRTIVGTDAKIGRLLAFWLLVWMDEMKPIGAFVITVLASLCKTGDLFGAALFPKDSVLSFEKMPVFLKFSSFGIEDSIEFVEGIDSGIGSTLDFSINKLSELGR